MSGGQGRGRGRHIDGYGSDSGGGSGSAGGGFGRGFIGGIGGIGAGPPPLRHNQNRSFGNSSERHGQDNGTRNFNNNRHHQHHNQQHHGRDRDDRRPAHHSHANGGPPSLANSFFNFAKNHLASVQTPGPGEPPLRWTQVKKMEEEWKFDKEPTTGLAPFLHDDNKDYVNYYLEQAEKKIADMRLCYQKYVAESEVDPSADNFLFGSVTEKGRYNDEEVFWKYKMDERPVNTSGLLINNYEDKIVELLKNNQVLVVEGFTGCGKSTQVPQFILNHAAATQSPVRIAVTQPRRIAAISVATRVCEERGWPLGSLVGYQVGMGRLTTDDTRLTYMTTGVLLQLLIGKKNVGDYTHIIIDEVHERDLDTDLLLLVIKKILIDRFDTKTKIILMSATLDCNKFLKYFPVLRELPSGNGELAVVSVKEASSYDVQEYYLDDLVSKFGADLEGFQIDGMEEPKVFEETYRLAARIVQSLDYVELAEQCRKQKLPVPNAIEDQQLKSSPLDPRDPRVKIPPRGAVLVFLPGYAEIDTMYKELEELTLLKSGSYNKQNTTKWHVLPLHSTITTEEQQRVFKPSPPGYRKIILATNIAESSITVTDIKYVIDFCLTKSLSCDAVTNYTCLRMEWASRNQCIQRRGRCGRVADGICYRLISRNFFFGAMAQEALPEMEKSSLESVVLNVKNLKMGPPLEVLALAIDPPKQSGIARAVANLKEVGALTLAIQGVYNAYDGEMTYMGEVMSKLPIDFRLARLIVLGHVFGCVDDAIIIAAALSTKSPFSNPYEKRLDAWLSKFAWSDRTYSDCMALLNCFNSWAQNHRSQTFRTHREEINWARTYFVQLSVVREIGNVVEEIKKRLETMNIMPDTFALNGLERAFILKMIIAGAFYPNYFYRSSPNKKEFEREIIKDCGGYSPLRTVALQGFPMDQPGELYAKHIAEKLTYATCIPKIYFRSSKVFVTFDPRGDKIGQISYGVYRAVKMQKLRERITFDVLTRDEAHKAADAANRLMSSTPILSAPSLVSLPSIKEANFDCFISHLESPNEFYVIRKSDKETFEIVEKMLESVTDTESKDGTLPPLTKAESDPGKLCLIMKFNKLLRGRIDAVLTNQALVYTIDMGLSVWVKFPNLFKVPQILRDQGIDKLPALAIPCRLAQVKPSSRHAHDWTVAAQKDFTEFVSQANNELFFKIFSVADGIVTGDLMNLNNQESLAELFINKTYMERATEPQESLDNNKARTFWKILRYDEVEVEAHNKRQVGEWEPTRYMVPPRLPDNAESKAITLRGPHSPLEMSFVSLCHSAHLKSVQFDGNSVNSVALDTDPFNPCSRVMVAANVGIAHRSGNLMVRETTVMPPIPGLLSLLTLVFAPRLEFRVNEDQSLYTGCVSGLGIDVETGMPVYPDHDMEVIFDVRIDNEDIELVNSIRMTCNVLLRETTKKFETILTLRETLRHEITRLVQREREAITEVWPTETHAWNKLEDVELFQTSQSFKTLPQDVFALHTGVVLRQPAENGVIPRNVFQG